MDLHLEFWYVFAMWPAQASRTRDHGLLGRWDGLGRTVGERERLGEVREGVFWPDCTSSVCTLLCDSASPLAFLCQSFTFPLATLWLPFGFPFASRYLSFSFRLTFHCLSFGFPLPFL